ncbi:MAG: hypothetical protein NTX04_03590, partial [Verrucomicrobia bacterium]|nr:hypothetical protein [Verrucomicrobiota bacterium]
HKRGGSAWGVGVEYLSGVVDVDVDVVVVAAADAVAVTGVAGKRLPKVDYRDELLEGDFGVFCWRCFGEPRLGRFGGGETDNALGYPSHR